MDAQEADGPAGPAGQCFIPEHDGLLPLLPRSGPTSRVASQTSSCFSSSWIQTQTRGKDFGWASSRWKFCKGLQRLEMPPSMPFCLVSFQPRTDLAMSPYRSMWTTQRCWAEKKNLRVSATSQLDFKKFLTEPTSVSESVSAMVLRGGLSWNPFHLCADRALHPVLPRICGSSPSRGLGRSEPKGRYGGCFASHPTSWRFLCL